MNDAQILSSVVEGDDTNAVRAFAIDDDLLPVGCAPFEKPRPAGQMTLMRMLGQTPERGFDLRFRLVRICKTVLIKVIQKIGERRQRGLRPFEILHRVRRAASRASASTFEMIRPSRSAVSPASICAI